MVVLLFGLLNNYLYPPHGYKCITSQTQVAQISKCYRKFPVEELPFAEPSFLIHLNLFYFN